MMERAGVEKGEECDERRITSGRVGGLKWRESRKNYATEGRQSEETEMHTGRDK